MGFVTVSVRLRERDGFSFFLKASFLFRRTRTPQSVNDSWPMVVSI